jgi:hypothetical protein
MNPLQNTIGNVHESNITGFINNNFPQTTATTTTRAGNSSNNNCNDPFCNCNNGIAMLNNDTFPAHTTDHNNNYQQSISNITSNNDDIISPVHNYQKPIFSDASNNNVGHTNYHQTTPINVFPPQFCPQYNDQNSPQSTSSNILPLLNSLGITIYSPQINIIIAPMNSSADIRNLIQQDHTYSNTDSS